MRIRLLLSLLCSLLPAGVVHSAERQYQEVVVAEPFLEMRTGPGQGYPIFYAVSRGESVEIHARQSDWFKIETQRGKAGWVDRAQMDLTLRPDGEAVAFEDTSREDWEARRWEVGMLYGDFGGADIISTYGSFALNANITTEIWVSQILGNFSNGYMASANIVHTFFPEWRASPFFTLGTGVLKTEPKTTLVQSEDRQDQVAHVGLGVRTYLTQRFVFRAEYKSYVVFTSRDDNEEIQEWKAGFSFFF